MAVPPEYFSFPGINPIEHDFCFDLHPHRGAFASSSSPTCHNLLSMSLSHQSLDCILQLQSERLRLELAEQTRQNIAVLLASLEAKAVRSIRQKEGDVALATKKTRELEARLVRTELASNLWQKLAKEKEATIVELSHVLERVRENAAGDAESSCEAAPETNKMGCKVCHRRSSCVVILPCRHLCSCDHCEPSLASCPVCQTHKETSMEVFFSGSS